MVAVNISKPYSTEEDIAFFQTCYHCNSPVEVSYDATAIDGKMIRQTECIQCHVRTFRHVYFATKGETISPMHCASCNIWKPVYVISQDHKSFICTECSRKEKQFDATNR